MADAAADPDDTLDLDPEWGGGDLAESIEAAFGFEIPVEEARETHTVADVYALILRHVRAQPGRCATSMAFYRLRRALGASGVKLSPDSPLEPFTRTGARAFRDRLQSATGLNLPAMAGGWLSGLGFAALVAFLVLLIGWVVFKGWFAGAGALAAFGLAVLLFRIDPQILPQDCRTLGGLARRTATRSFGRLAAEGASVDEAGVWEALKTLLVEDCEADPKRIRPSATLFRA